jgi:hypothetical protein
MSDDKLRELWKRLRTTLGHADALGAVALVAITSLSRAEGLPGNAEKTKRLAQTLADRLPRLHRGEMQERDVALRAELETRLGKRQAGQAFVLAVALQRHRLSGRLPWEEIEALARSLLDGNEAFGGGDSRPTRSCHPRPGPREEAPNQQ